MCIDFVADRKRPHHGSTQQEQGRMLNSLFRGYSVVLHIHPMFEPEAVGALSRVPRLEMALPFVLLAM